jgi:hypothetical protein
MTRLIRAIVGVRIVNSVKHEWAGQESNLRPWD